MARHQEMQKCKKCLQHSHFASILKYGETPRNKTLAEGVGFEPVSTSEFPANREINREFRGIPSACVKFERRHASKFMGFAAKFPTQQNRELFVTEQGIWTAPRGMNRG